MKILIIGSKGQLEEAKRKLGPKHTYQFSSDSNSVERHINESDAVFDFVMADPDRARLYSHRPSTIVFLNTSYVTLSKLAIHTPGTLFGFCGMPTFFDREILEVTLQKEEDRPVLKKLCDELKTGYQTVSDRVGLVTPRVICMIINEAYYTVEEGTATREDVDMAMKLGTNYPFGPFEWCERIGSKNVCGLLDAVYEDTKDERYSICRLLRDESTV